MPRQVDHDGRRREIAAAVARIAATRGVQDVSFREVAAEAGMSVGMIQHYFDTKHDIFVRTLAMSSETIGRRIADRISGLGPDPAPIEQVRTIAAAFIPVDSAAREGMLVYHGFAAAALTDQSLRSDETFGNGWAVIDVLSGHLRSARQRGDVDERIDPNHEAVALISLVLGLSLGVLLEQIEPSYAMETLDHHIQRLSPR